MANCFYVAIQAAFVLFTMDHRVWFERPPPLRSPTMTARDRAKLLQNTCNWFSTLPVPRGSTWHREAADALHVLAAHKSLYVPLTNEVFPAVLAYRLREFASNPTQVWAHWSSKRWGSMPHGIRTGTARTLRDYTLGTSSRPSSWITSGAKFFFVWTTHTWTYAPAERPAWVDIRPAIRRRRLSGSCFFFSVFLVSLLTLGSSVIIQYNIFFYYICAKSAGCWSVHHGPDQTPRKCNGSVVLCYRAGPKAVWGAGRVHAGLWLKRTSRRDV